MADAREPIETRVAKALAHPLRVRILAHLREHGRASPGQLATAWGDVPLNTVSYHMRRLQALGFVRLVRRTPRRGVLEHHYALSAGAEDALVAAGEGSPTAQEVLRNLDAPAPLGRA